MPVLTPEGAAPWPAALTALYLVLLFGCAQFGTDGLYDHDGYFHARYAQQFSQRGLSREFPWTQASTWRDRFCDKEFLYHALMTPFARDAREPIRGVRWFSLALSLAVCAVLYGLLRAQRVPWPWLWPAALTIASGTFLLRLEMTRSHVLSILLALGGVHFLLGRRGVGRASPPAPVPQAPTLATVAQAAARAPVSQASPLAPSGRDDRAPPHGRWLALGILGFVYAWSYTFPFVLVLIAAPFVLGKWMGGGGLDWRSPVAALAGVVLGLVVHPYTPLTLETFLTYLDVLRLAAVPEGAGPIRMAGELYPLDAREFLLAYPLVHAGLLALAVAAWLLPRKLEPETVGVLLAAILWYGVMMVYQRMCEYAVPLVLVGVALGTRDLLAGVEWRRDLYVPRRALAVALVALAAMAVAGGAAGAWRQQWTATRDAEGPRFRGAVAWLAGHTQPDETVVNLCWDDFPDLYYDGCRQRYLCGLDPTYLWRWDREKARLLEGMRYGRMPLDGAKLSAAFGARYLVVSRTGRKDCPALAKGEWKPVYEDPAAAVYDLR
jgi:hypothetical protein